MIGRDLTFAHLDRLSDGVGLFEHADGITPRWEHGYCTDDNARLLVVAAREPDDGTPGRLGRLAFGFCRSALAADGRVRNRLDRAGAWADLPDTKDWWGRAVWAFGAAATHHDDADLRSSALAAFELSARRRSAWPRAMAFAALGAADVLSTTPDHAVARSLLRDAVDVIGIAGGSGRSGRSERPAWPWPEPRLAYANAAIPEALIAAGSLLGDTEVLDRGLDLLWWTIEQQTRDGHLSVVGTRGRAPGDPTPQFDQQPIEVAAIADACWRAHSLTGDARWSRTVVLAAEWFDGANDASAAMWDPHSGGGYDGLRADGPNTNQGAESTLAFVSTVQRARAAQVVAA